MELSEIMNLILTFVLTVSTIILTFYTYKLVTESRKIRKVQASPLISFTLGHAETDITLLFLEFRNMGQGPAYNLEFKVKKDFPNYIETTKLSDRGLFSEGMQFCPPNYSKKIFLTSMSKHHEEKIKDILIFDVAYKNVFNEQILESFELNLAETKGTSKISPADTYIGRISDNISEINKNLKII